MSTKTPYNVVITESAHKELQSLSGDVKKQAKAQIKKLYTSPELGVPLGNKGSYNLTECYKLEFYKKKQYRIVYSWQKNVVTVQVIAINKRDKMTAHKIAAQWLKENQ